MSEETDKKVPSKVKEEASSVPPKIRIRVQAYEYALLDESVKQIYDTCVRLGAEVLGPIPLPTQKRKYTENRSTFVHKDAREQFEMGIHRRFLDIKKPSQRIVEALSNLTIPSSVSVKVQLS